MDTSSIITSAITGVIISAINIYYVRKNLKTTKYIDIITKEKIRLIKITGTDLSELISSILVHLKNEDYYTELIVDKELQDYANSISGRDIDTFSNEELIDYSGLRRNIGHVENAMENVLTRSEIINKAISLKLNFNPVNDIDIINQLNIIIEDFANYSNQIKDFKIDMDELVEKSQIVLNEKWKDIESEVDNK